MHLVYFDEVKFEAAKSNYFFLGGIIISDKDAIDLEKSLSRIQYNFFQKTYLSGETEMHGKDIYHGKYNCKGRKVSDRIDLFKDVLGALQRHNVASRIVRLNVPAHKQKYTYPDPEYRLSLIVYSGEAAS